MLGRFLLLLIGSLALGASLVQAQPTPQEPLPEACRTTPNGTMPELEASRKSLERDIARQATSIERIPDRRDGKAGVEADARALELRKNLRAKQEELLEVLFRIECVRSAALAQEPPSRNPFESRAKKLGAIEVTTYYATNRKQTDSVEPAKTYGAGFESTLQYGRAIVSIPATHVPGNLELPTLWKLQRDADASKHFVLQAVMPLNADAARKELSLKLQSMSSKALLVFVHGYNMGFAEAALTHGTNGP